ASVGRYKGQGGKHQSEKSSFKHVRLISQSAKKFTVVTKSGEIAAPRVGKPTYPPA
ncbi:MAG: hypothetical protein ACI9ZM_002659, partial [Paracoccaceae bacterium]